MTVQRPLLGVLVSKQRIKNLKRNRPGNKLRILAEANEVAGVNLFFFSIYDVNITKNAIRGIRYDSSSLKWICSIFPFPDALYYQGTNRKRRAKVVNFLDCLQKRNVKFINYAKGFNKWTVYKILARNPNLKIKLPVTHRCTTKKRLLKMLDNYNPIYLKACRGRKGYQVMRVEKLADNSYKYSYFSNRVRTKIVTQTDQLASKIRRFFKKKKFIMQQQIDLVLINNQKYDLRAEVQRNGNGELVITAVAARTGMPNSPITTHGTAYSLDTFFTMLNLDIHDATELKKNITRELVKIYQTIEDYYGPIGELGIDFAIDRDHQLWFIECNSQSAKVSLMRAYDHITVKNAFLYPLEYTKFLTRKN